MDFLVFKTNHGLEYAINIADLIAIIQTPEITFVPGAPKGIIGMFSYLGRLIPIIDTNELYHDEMKISPLTMILTHKQPYAILIQQVGNIMRGDVPEGVRFIDPYDYEKSILGFNKEAIRVELF